jgi:hypothetical protein
MPCYPPICLFPRSISPLVCLSPGLSIPWSVSSPDLSVPSICLIPQSVCSLDLSVPSVCLCPPVCLFPWFVSAPQSVSSPDLSPRCLFHHSRRSQPRHTWRRRGRAPGVLPVYPSIHPIAVICMRECIRHLEEPTLLPDWCTGHPVEAPVGAPEPATSPVATRPRANHAQSQQSNSNEEAARVLEASSPCARLRLCLELHDMALGSVALPGQPRRLAVATIVDSAGVVVQLQKRHGRRRLHVFDAQWSIVVDSGGGGGNRRSRRRARAERERARDAQRVGVGILVRG